MVTIPSTDFYEIKSTKKENVAGKSTITKK